MTPNTQFKGRIVAVLNSAGVAQWLVVISDTQMVIGGGNVPSGGNYSDTVNGTNVNIALVDTPYNLSTIATRAALAVTNAGYKNAMPAFLSDASPAAASANGIMNGYLMAYDQSGKMVYFTVTYQNYWTVKVDGVTMETVLHTKPSKIYDGTKALSGKGTGYLDENGDYQPYSVKPDLTSVTSAVTMTTGYATSNNMSGLTTGITGGTVSITGLTHDGTTYYFKVDNGLTITYTTKSGNSAAGDPMNLELKVATPGVVVNNPIQQMSEANYETAGKQLTWTLNTSNISANITTNPDIKVTATAAPQSRTISYATSSTANGLTATVSGVGSAMDGEKIIVSVNITGTATAASKVTISNATGAWIASTLGQGITTIDNTAVAIPNGASYNITLQFEVTVSSANPSGAITATVANNP